MADCYNTKSPIARLRGYYRSSRLPAAIVAVAGAKEMTLVLLSLPKTILQTYLSLQQCLQQMIGRSIPSNAATLAVITSKRIGKKMLYLLQTPLIYCFPRYFYFSFKLLPIFPSLFIAYVKLFCFLLCRVFLLVSV